MFQGKLKQVQYAAGHRAPRTTACYQARKLNLDDNAVDYLKLTATREKRILLAINLLSLLLALGKDVILPVLT